MATAAIVGGTLLSAKLGSDASKKASRAQAGAADRAGALAEQRFNETKQTLNPFINAGETAQTQQMALSGVSGPEAQRQAYANYTESPGVQFAREQGLRAIESDASMTGRAGGSRLKAITEFSQGLALQDFNNQYNRVQNLAQQGLSAATSLGGVSTNMTNAQTNQITASGAAQAGGILGRSNAINQGIGGLTQLAAKRLTPPPVTG